MRPESEWVALEFAGLSLTLRIMCMLQSVSPIIKGQPVGTR